VQPSISCTQGGANALEVRVGVVVRLSSSEPLLNQRHRWSVLTGLREYLSNEFVLQLPLLLAVGVSFYDGFGPFFKASVQQCQQVFGNLCNISIPIYWVK
jgi:hypothetical protein